jgi:hypothetical protein
VVAEFATALRLAGINPVFSFKLNVCFREVGIPRQGDTRPPLAVLTVTEVNEHGFARNDHAEPATLALGNSGHAGPLHSY